MQDKKVIKNDDDYESGGSGVIKVFSVQCPFAF